jgi:nicotinamidase-related amidase
VIDVQNEYFTGNLRLHYPDPYESVHNIGIAMDAARAATIPVVVVQHSAPADSMLFAEGSPGWQLHSVVADRMYDHFVQKRLPSALCGTGVEAWTRAHNVDTLTLAGYMTHNCIASTAFQALHCGFAAVIGTSAWITAATGRRTTPRGSILDSTRPPSGVDDGIPT